MRWHSDTPFLTPDRRSSRREYLSLFVASLLLVGTAACGERDLRTELIPGTEYVEFNDGPWFTISQDERWMAFMEVDSVHWGLDQPNTAHLITFELSTLQKTHHHLHDIPTQTFPSGGRPGEAPWDIVRIHFKEEGWSAGSFYVHVRWPRPRTSWIVFVPQIQPAGRVGAPAALGCLDCPPPESLNRLRAANGIGQHVEIAAATRGGALSTSFYRAVSHQTGAVIQRIDPDGNATVVFEEKRAFKEVHVRTMRVSPDERYLAFVLETTLKSPVPLPTMRSELHVLDIAIGHSQNVAGGEARVVGNIMWAADSKRFYYASMNDAVADGRGRGIFVVRVPVE